MSITHALAAQTQSPYLTWGVENAKKIAANSGIIKPLC